jgi:hypothetical protein
MGITGVQESVTIERCDGAIGLLHPNVPFDENIYSVGGDDNSSAVGASSHRLPPQIEALVLEKS